MRVEPISAVILKKYETRRMAPSFGAILGEVHKKALMRKTPILSL